MLRLVSSKLLSRVNAKATTFRSHGFIFSYFSLRPISEIPSSAEPPPFTVSHLRNSHTLSQESAISASEKLCIETPEKADSFMRLLKAYGLTETHVKRIIEVRPSLLLADLDDKIRRNLELFKSYGISGNELGKMLCLKPRFLVCKAHEFVELLRANGFSSEQITAVATKRPLLLLLNPNENIKPKLEFFRSIGLTDGDVTTLVSMAPYILGRSLEKQLIPCFKVLRRVIGSDINVTEFVKKSPNILDENMGKLLEPNISMLKSYGASKHLIVKVFISNPRVFPMNLDRLAEILDVIVKLGIDPNKPTFVRAVFAMASITKERWEKNVEAYKGFGLSVDQIHSAFRRQPKFMIVSEKKLRISMDFLLNKLNMEISEICGWPSILTLSLEKRVIPRCKVVRLLMSNGLIKQNHHFASYLGMSEKKFLEKVVNKYREVLPEIVEAYKGKIVI